MRQRDANIEIVKNLLRQLPDSTLECTGNFSINFARFLNEDNVIIDIDRIVMACAYDLCQVYLDQLNDKGGIEKTFIISELTDDDIERLLQLFGKEKVERIKKEYNR